LNLEAKSKELKEIVATYDADWFLGDLSALIHAGRDRANDQLGNLSSPLRQLYYLAGLNVSSEPTKGYDIQYTPEKWDKVVDLLNEIEAEYYKIFFPADSEEVNEEWMRIRQVAMPSFLSYFNQGPLNFEEQVINWTRDLYTEFDHLIEGVVGVKTEDFILFYENLDQLCQRNFQAHTLKKELLRPNWEKYTKIKMGVVENAPDFIKEMGEQKKHLFMYMTDKGIKDRFYPDEITSETLTIEKVRIILNLLSTRREQTDFLYYTATKPGNPLYEKPIIDIGEGMFQIFEVKQLIHAVGNLLEQICAKESRSKYLEKKGKLLEDKIVELFTNFFKTDFKVFRGYFVDGCEQDLLFLWKNYAFIIEAKGYALREPFRDPDKAFVRIKQDFNACIGYGYTQTHRVEKKFIDGAPLKITDKEGNIIEEIDTTQYDEDFSIIVNLNSFGQIQCDLSTLLELENDDDVYPFAIRLDDLETLLLTFIAQSKEPQAFVDFLLKRETCHGKLICSDELEISGALLTNKIKQKEIYRARVITTHPDFSDVFDQQYKKVMGFKNEKYLSEKQSGNYLFW
jgi:hypothetical protein